MSLNFAPPPSGKRRIQVSVDDYAQYRRGDELIARDRLALIIYGAMLVVAFFVAYSIWLNPRGRRRREEEER